MRTVAILGVGVLLAACVARRDDLLAAVGTVPPATLAGWIDFYNRRRPHGALSHKPPIARLHERNNLLGSYT